jgi:hypothetical protein
VDLKETQKSLRKAVSSPMLSQKRQHEAVSKMIDDEGLLPLLSEKACDADLAKSKVAEDSPNKHR